MSFRDTVHDWIDSGFTSKAKNPTLSKRLVIENLNQILNLLEQGNDGESPYLAAKGISQLISDIEDDKLKPGNL